MPPTASSQLGSQLSRREQGHCILLIVMLSTHPSDAGMHATFVDQRGKLATRAALAHYPLNDRTPFEHQPEVITVPRSQIVAIVTILDSLIHIPK